MRRLRIFRSIKVFLKSFADFFNDGGIMLAGSISYFAMMTIIPFCLLIVAVFGYLLGEHESLLRFFTAKLTAFFPSVTSGVTNELQKLIAHKGLGKFTLVIYGILSYNLFSSLENALNAVFKIKVKRSFIISVLLSLTVITLIIIFIIVSFGASSAISMLVELRDFFPDLRIGHITRFLIKYVIPLILIFLIATAMYKIFPKKKVKLDNALTGAFFTAVFLEVAKHIFTFYVVKVVRFGTIYGPLSAFVIFLLWVYYSSCIFLIGAEVVHNLEGSSVRK